ncbi:MAG: thioredoxin domain-containing protein [Bdellovibrionales bacterium]|nr:thioredoxin domain-containing protein [Bdellovibrionales bacterium]
MKTFQIIALVIGSSIVTFVITVLFTINMVSITPENLSKVIKEDPLLFLTTIQETAKLADEKRQKKQLAEEMKNPKQIETKGRVVFGPENAPVTIVKFSDFQCGYCARAAKNMASLRKKHEGKLRLVYRHFPLRGHPFAKPTAEYFEAVALISHDKAREFHDEIFYNFPLYARLSEEKEINEAIDSILEKIGLNKSDVEENLEEAKKVVSADLEEVEKLNLQGTPSFFVNGVSAKNIRIEELIEKFIK